MDIVTLSSKYQVVIPRRIRERVRLKPGTKLQVISFDDSIELFFKKLLRDLQNLNWLTPEWPPYRRRLRDAIPGCGRVA